MSVKGLIDLHEKMIIKGVDDIMRGRLERISNDVTIVDISDPVPLSVVEKKYRYKNLERNAVLYMPQKDYKIAKQEDYDLYVPQLEELYPEVLTEDYKQMLNNMTKAHIYANRRPKNSFLVNKCEAFTALNNEVDGGYLPYTKQMKEAIIKLKRIKKIYGNLAKSVSKECKEEIKNQNREKKKADNKYMIYMKGQKKKENESLKEYKNRCLEGYAVTQGFENYDQFKNDRNSKKNNRVKRSYNKRNNNRTINKENTMSGVVKKMEDIKRDYNMKIYDLKEIEYKSEDEKKELNGLKVKLERINKNIAEQQIIDNLSKKRKRNIKLIY